jgi:hypothetical protein
MGMGFMGDGTSNTDYGSWIMDHGWGVIWGTGLLDWDFICGVDLRVFVSFFRCCCFPSGYIEVFAILPSSHADFVSHFFLLVSGLI